MNRKIVVIGGGAAGFFGALSCAEHFPHHQINIFEKNRQVLSKVRISGGGRCNVTHSCFDPSMLIKNYPRGHRELRGPFSRFQPRDTIHWFESRGVTLKTEKDGRMFPITDSSETIIQCFMKEIEKKKIELCLEHGIEKITKVNPSEFELTLTNGNLERCHRILIATGSSAKIYPLLQELGHTIVPLVPSLFTFNIPDSPFLDLSGISLPSVEVALPKIGLKQIGAFLFTHWGLSGPAILKLSAWAARELAALNYQTLININWLPSWNESEVREKLVHSKKDFAAKQMGSDCPFDLPKQLWKRLLFLSGSLEEARWATLSQKQLQILLNFLCCTPLQLHGKTTYKQEFVTCGGVSLEEVNFKKMESKCCPGLHFAGEILNIDGVTGGFNFQNAWTTAWIAGQSME